MKRNNIFTIILLFITCFVNAQEYDITFWGIPVGFAKFTQDSDSEMTSSFGSSGFVDKIFPVNLEYNAVYNETDFSTMRITKTSGDKKIYDAKLGRGNVFIYDEQDSVALEPNTLSLFSMLAKLVESSVDSIDGRWFNLESEGVIYKSRLLWNDTTSVSINNDNILCDHYRLDLELLNEESRILDKTDYFNELFFDINSIRQIWVEKWQKQPRLIQITLKNNLVKLKIAITN